MARHGGPEKYDVDDIARQQTTDPEPLRPRNQIESLEKEVAYLKEILRSRDEELLSVYRTLFRQGVVQ